MWEREKDVSFCFPIESERELHQNLPKRKRNHALGSSSPGIWTSLKPGRAAAGCRSRGAWIGAVAIAPSSGQQQGGASAEGAAVIFDERVEFFFKCVFPFFVISFFSPSAERKQQKKRKEQKRKRKANPLPRARCPASPAAASRQPSASPRAWPTATRAMRGEEKKKGKECCERRKIIRGSD